MGILKNFFKNSSDSSTESGINWLNLASIEELDRIVKTSYDKSVAIFKYSTRCGLSRMVLRQLEKNYDISINEPDWYFLDLIQFRAVSNEISNRFQVRHESPQLLLVKKGEVIYHNSHSAIDMNAIQKIAI